MGEVASYTVLGLSLGGIFALAALGIVLIYRVTGVLNFAHGAMGMFSTFVAWGAVYKWHQSPWVAVLLALAFAAAFGLFLQFAVFRFFSGRPPVVKAVVTIGILLVLQSAASLLWGNNQYHEPIHLVGGRSFFIARVPVGPDQMLIILASLVLALAIAAFLTYTRFGIAMRAVSDDPVAAGLWGVPVWIVGAASWALGSLLAAIAGILITPFINLDTISLTLLILDALAAALIGGLVSLPLTVLGGFLLGLAETYPEIWIKNSLGFPKLIAILVIVAVLVFRAPRGLLQAEKA